MRRKLLTGALGLVLGLVILAMAPHSNGLRILWVAETGGACRMESTHFHIDGTITFLPAETVVSPHFRIQPLGTPVSPKERPYS